MESDSVLETGIDFAQNKDYEQAITCFSSINNNDKNFTKALYNLGLIFAKLGNKGKARDYWSQISENNEEVYSETQYCLGLMWFDEKEYTLAKRAWNKIKSGTKYYNITRIHIGSLFYRGLQYKDALEYLCKVPSETTEFSTSKYYIANIQNNLSNPEGFLNETKDLIVTNIIRNNFDYFAFANMNLLVNEIKENQKYYEWVNKETVSRIYELEKEFFTHLFYKESQKNIDVCYKNFGEKEKIVLFQYRPFTKETIFNIQNEEIYFSNPSGFNDPFDPLIRVIDSVYEVNYLNKLCFRSTCLSEEWNNILLWSHYADKHKGVCIAYDITELVKQDNIIFGRIEYGTEHHFFYDPIETGGLPDFINEHRAYISLIDSFLKKKKEWEYEKEYRMLLNASNSSEFLKKCPIFTVFLGKDMPKKEKDFLKDMIDGLNNDGRSQSIQINEVSVEKDYLFTLGFKPYEKNSV